MTQGDLLAMTAHAVALMPMAVELQKEGMLLEDHLQPSCADDLMVAGKAKTCAAILKKLAAWGSAR